MHYEKSPIVEALIDIKVEASPEPQFESLQTLSSSLNDFYPRVETRMYAAGQFTFGAETKATAEQKPYALMLFSRDDKQVVQARTDGISVSRLAPYTGWDALSAEARKLWDMYHDFVRPAKVTRLAVRYINQFMFPKNRIEVEDYLRTFPELSHGLPTERRDMNAFLMRLSVPQPDLKGMLQITETVNNAVQGTDVIPIVLDLELIVDGLTITVDGELWSKLKELHARQALYFEASITDRTRELIS